MDEALAYVNGELIPAGRLAVPVYDTGFVLGATVTEQLRTFQGWLFRAGEHLLRLARSLEIVGVDPGIGLEELGLAAEDLASRNARLLAAGDDLGLCMFVTPGPYPTMAEGASGGPMVCLHTYPLPFERWAAGYAEGVQLATTDVRQVPPECWPHELKCRSRMHYYLADREASARFPGARALLLDLAGRVIETSTANVVLYSDGELVSPPPERILPGISLRVLEELASAEGIALGFRDLTAEDVAAAEEVLLTSTPYCLLPCTRFNGRAIGSGEPGAVFGRLLGAWSRRVGVEIAEQAARFADRGGSSA